MDDLFSVVGIILFVVVLIAVFDPQRLGRIGGEIACGFRGDCPVDLPTP